MLIVEEAVVAITPTELLCPNVHVFVFDVWEPLLVDCEARRETIDIAQDEGRDTDEKERPLPQQPGLIMFRMLSFGAESCPCRRE